ncbi:MAG: hypothetical protein KGZ37_04335 [Nitrosarchaeum sp.]|nr:hypothetical protein [Nitrosarchaeum sp.]
MTIADPFKMLKKNQFIVIFGGYKENGYQKLLGLRDSLRNNGYDKTFLVTDLQNPKISKKNKDPDAIIAEKSLHWAKKAQVGLFVIFKDIPYGSASVEMTTRLSTHQELAKCSSFFLETGTTLQIVERGLIKLHDNYNVAYFDSKNDLFKMAKAYCFTHMLQDKCGDTTML